MKERMEILQRNPVNLAGSFDPQVSSILRSVRRAGDLAVQKYNKQWGGAQSHPLLYTKEDFLRALQRIDDPVREALREAAKEIRQFHRHQVRKNIRMQKNGKELGVRFVPHKRVAVYVPGGKALYPSTVLMGVIPARLAGVSEVVVLSPAAADGLVHDVILAACALAEADALYGAGGAQSIGAAAYGTAALAPVTMIVGPGNNFVTRAKWQVNQEDRVAIDSPAGPSEVLILAEAVVSPEWLAADLLSQAEHGSDSMAILATADESLANDVAKAVAERLRQKSRRLEHKLKSIQEYGHILLFPSLEEMIHFSNDFAPEHLQIITKRDDYILERIVNAGSVFIGPYSPVAAGDYCSGTNHILPTSGMAGLYSGLNVETFYKRFTYQKLEKKGLARLRSTIDTLSQTEGLDEEHGRSVHIRFDPK